ncbi:hypothetical protein CDEST_12787 [Colletotrichum destructivum]|uniref:Uncharacterized protein n=1 Tax=Colletotrichum destructivum TaxID=34406 RepID=A0AAX4IXA2_9PEZI|nr:hypothetical protein CDEST_12787 [Colletotrichum destructivum]
MPPKANSLLDDKMTRIKNPFSFNDDPARDIAIDLSGNTRGLIPSIERNDDDGDDEAQRPRFKAPKKKKLSKKAQGKRPIRKEEEEEEDMEEEEKDKLRKYEELLTTLKISLENTQGTMRRSIVDMFRARNHLNARVNDLETYVGSIDDDDEEDEGQQNRRSLAQRQDGCEVAQDHLSEQQMVLASQQQRLDRRLAEIEYCLHLNASERSQSAPPRPADPAAGLFPPWSEGYWGGRRSPSRLVGVWGPRSTRSSRGEGVLPGTGSGSGAAVINNMGGNGGIRSLGPPVSGPTSTIPAKRKSRELEEDDVDENDRQKKSGKGGKKQKNNSGSKVEGEDQEAGLKQKTTKATNAKKSKGKDKAKTTGIAKPAPKILLKVSEYQRAKDQERGEGEKEDHRTGKARPKLVLPKNEKRKAEDDGDDEENPPRRNRANTRSQTGAKNQKGATTAAAPQATSESTSSKTTSEAPPNTESKTAPKIILKRRRGDDADPDDNDDDEDDEEPEKKKAKIAPKKTKAAAPKKTTKKKAASKSKTRPSSQGAPPAPAGLAPVAPMTQPTDRLPPPDEDEFDY